MKKILIISLVIISLCFTFIIEAKNYKANDKFTTKKPLVLFDWDDDKETSNLGKEHGAFDADPNNAEASIKTEKVQDKELHKKGSTLKIIYDVESKKPATFNGIWIKLGSLDLRKFEAVSFNIKGDKDAGFTKTFKIEIKDSANKIEGIINGITSKWQKITLNFNDFEGDLSALNLKKITEFVIVFEDWRATTKAGILYMDDISFIPKKGVAVKFKDIAK